VLTQAPPADWIAEHRRVWARKAALRAVYERWFAVLHDACGAGAPAVELGCGAGLFKQRYPEVLATDATANPYAWPRRWRLRRGALGRVREKGALDRVLSAVPALTATRCTLTLERRG